MKTLILGILFGVGLCFDGWGCNLPTEMKADGEPQWGFVAPQVKQAVAEEKIQAIEEFQDDGVLYLSAPDSDVQDLLFSITDFYQERYPLLQIAVVPTGGIPVTLGQLEYETVDGDLVQVAGNAHSGVPCFGSECSNPAFGAGIVMDRTLWDEDGYSLNWKALAHEVGHVISGWGACYTGVTDPTGSHLGMASHLMSPVTTWNGVWDEQDDALICSCGAC